MLSSGDFVRMPSVAAGVVVTPAAISAAWTTPHSVACTESAACLAWIFGIAIFAQLQTGNRSIHIFENDVFRSLAAFPLLLVQCSNKPQGGALSCRPGSRTSRVVKLLCRDAVISVIP